ncbi:uncharacterized protein EI97DRAFT_497785 [Westerdykella ornata]|uniref:Uncharacterized protein n=1 Tax=Westerdykella ornata TaxID=318751 RepID=A0A6A6JWX5_WESOR|nr:uncharacterized protein EI97DRAFT_497785 [Westerdykella ornata]KAF2281112.1 hypothetical protein EI97DRAFT_497785 [Westerdykella ornata]
MTTNPGISPLIQQIISTVKYRFGKHINLDEERLLELAEKIDFIIRSKHIATSVTSGQANSDVPMVTVFIVPTADSIDHRAALVYNTKPVVQTVVGRTSMGSKGYEQLFHSFCREVDRVTDDILTGKTTGLANAQPSNHCLAPAQYTHGELVEKSNTIFYCCG